MFCSVHLLQNAFLTINECPFILDNVTWNVPTDFFNSFTNGFSYVCRMSSRPIFHQRQT